MSKVSAFGAHGGRADPLENERLWVGGDYDRREGIAMTVMEGGIHFGAWYDGGIWIEPQAYVTWAEIEQLLPGRDTGTSDK